MPDPSQPDRREAETPIQLSTQQTLHAYRMDQIEHSLAMTEKRVSQHIARVEKQLIARHERMERTMLGLAMMVLAAFVTAIFKFLTAGGSPS